MLEAFIAHLVVHCSPFKFQIETLENRSQVLGTRVTMLAVWGAFQGKVVGNRPAFLSTGGVSSAKRSRTVPSGVATAASVIAAEPSVAAGPQG